MLLWTGPSDTSNDSWHRAWITRWYMVTEQAYTTSPNRCIWYNWISRWCTSDKSTGNSHKTMYFDSMKTRNQPNSISIFYCNMEKTLSLSYYLRQCELFFKLNYSIYERNSHIRSPRHIRSAKVLRRGQIHLHVYWKISIFVCSIFNGL